MLDLESPAAPAPAVREVSAPKGSGQLLFPRIRLRDDQTDGVLIEALESTFALEILKVTHDRPPPTKCFCRMGI